MVAFVEDHESELMAEPLHVQVRGIVGGHGDGLDVVVSPADQPDFGVELAGNHAVPLLHQVDGRNDDQRAALDAGHAHERDESLARAGRQYDDAPSARLPPGVHGLLLVGKGGPVRLEGQVQLPVGPGVVLVGDAPVVEPGDDLAVMSRRRAVQRHPPVERAAGQGQRVHLVPVAVHQDGPAVEFESEHGFRVNPVLRTARPAGWRAPPSTRR